MANTSGSTFMDKQEVSRLQNICSTDGWKIARDCIIQDNEHRQIHKSKEIYTVPKLKPS